MRKILTTILLIFFIGGPFVFHFMEPTRVSGSSMSPTLDDGDRILLNTFNKINNRGDIVVFHTKENTLFIKRIIGIEGDQVKIREGSVYLNGQKLDEPYVDGKGTLFGLEMIVPEGHVYVIGDNRSNSVDSRVLGAVLESDILGSLMLRIPFWHSKNN